MSRNIFELFEHKFSLHNSQESINISKRNFCYFLNEEIVVDSLVVLQERVAEATSKF